MILKAERQAKGRVVELHESVSVLALAQFGHSCFQLPHPSIQILLGPLATGQVKMQHLGYGLMVTQITALKGHAMRGWVTHSQFKNTIILHREKKNKTHIYESGKILKVVFVHAGVCCSQVEQVIIACFCALKLNFLNFILPLCKYTV